MNAAGPWNTVTDADFAAWFRSTPEELGPAARRTLGESDLRWRTASRAEAEEHLLDYLRLLKGNQIVRDREQNRAAWTRGWQENLDEIRRAGPSWQTCRPRYFRGNRFLRLRKDLVVTPNPHLEHNLFTALRQHLFARYLTTAPAICEIGSGSGQNLWMLSEMFPEKRIVGLDWVEPCVAIAGEIAKVGRRVEGHLFDMLEPDPALSLPPGSAIITIHALEQIGTNYRRVLEWIISRRPSLVLHHEPVLEFYDPSNLYDALAIWYSEKRNYLQGYLTALRELESEGKVEIESAFRPEVGGVVHECSVIVWRPR